MINHESIVLIAEDEENSRVLLENTLSAVGYRVLSASNGQEAIALAKTCTPDIIVSDILMPVMDGYALCRCIKKDEALKQVPFIFYTATYTDREDEVLALSLGADRFIVKPVEMQELLRIMEETIESSSKGKASVREPQLPDEQLEQMHNERLQSKLNNKLAELDSERKRLLESEQRFRDYAEASSDWFWESDRDMVITKITSGPPELLFFGLSGLAKRIECATDPVDDPHQGYLESLRQKKAFQDVILEFEGSNQRLLTIRFSGKPYYDSHGEFQGYRGVGRDMTETVALIHQIEYLATHDELTGLPNRSHFWECLNLALSRARLNVCRLSLLFIDVDHFKRINDTLGHDAGDQLLQEIAARIRRTIREHDTIARIGSDEFVLLIEEEYPSGAHRVALDILKQFEAPILVREQRIFVTVSIGLSVYPDDTQQAKMLLSYADLAMYRAKEQGRNSFQYFTDELNLAAHEWLSIENGLHQALERNELFLLYQPQIDLKSRRLIGVEALIRWRHPERGLIMPDKFIPIAEQSGLIVNLGRWCLDTACRQIRAWDSENFYVPRVAVNISARHVRNSRISEDVCAALAAHGVEPGRIGIEITEHTLLENVDTISHTLNDMHRRGTYLALDDFGTGYSSLGYLKLLPVDELKIDRSFIRGVAERDDDIAIVKAVIALGKTLGKKVLAEGVENFEQAGVLEALGCDAIQGYLVAKPLSSVEVKSWTAPPLPFEEPGQAGTVIDTA
ncbi:MULTISPECIES: two-component system response regulator [Methylomicrobium]|uniref:cyclic-guanylate-specific phosphodiesterase n=1 Tax=Methylomicrobium album BG8 TaxID=686340 RepID=H8GN04_METAL|nr:MULTISPECIES: EAL domain-containing protein [Methylomicrobium]EIC30718.1 diguanylate cyclase (GGDEF) domain-containing protein [Methylomicrobium album BG8]